MPPRRSPQTERVVDLFELLAADRGSGLSLAEVSRRLGVHKASCHSMLTELLRCGWVLRDPTTKTYHLGPALVRLGTAAASRFPALDLARPVMAELVASTGAHCIAFAIGTDHVTVVDQVRNLRVHGHPMPVGTQLPIRPPYGASVATWSQPEDQERWLDQLPEGAREHYRRALQTTRQRGYTVGLHVLEDVRLQELASLIRAADRHGGRVSDLAAALTEELVYRKEWFVATLATRRTYDVSHLDAPVFGADGRPALMLSLVPVPSELKGAAVARLGKQLCQATCTVTVALGGQAKALSAAFD